MCRVYKHNSFFRFRKAKCRLGYIYRYRFGVTVNQITCL